MARRIFINYRRGDSSPTAGRLRDHLVQAFGEHNVFMDVESIPAGVDFVDYLKSQIASFDIFLVLIGPDWLEAKDETGRRRIDNTDDPVTMEITTALQHKSRVVPVTIDGARMPTMDELPTPIKSLARRNAVDLRNTHFRSDVDSLIAKIDSRKWWNRWPAKAAGIAIVILFAVSIGVSFWQRHTAVVVAGKQQTIIATPETKGTKLPAPAGQQGTGLTQTTIPLNAIKPAEVKQPSKTMPAKKAIVNFNIEQNLDIYGQDILQPNGQIGIPNSNLEACAAECDRDGSCVAFSFDHLKSYCYPKNKIVAPVLLAGSVSATKKPARVPSKISGPIKIQVIRNRRFQGQPRESVRAENFQACSDICKRDGNDFAFSFLKTARTTKNCLLFNSVEAGYADDPSADSGYEYQSPP